MRKKPHDEVQLKLRFEERLRARLAKAAAMTDTSMNTEIIRRLERSFADEDVVAEALGGDELRHVALAFVSSFADGCRSAARDAGHADWGATAWLQNKDCCREGIARALTATLESAPDFSLDDMELLRLDLETRMAAAMVRSGALTFTFDDVAENAATEPSIHLRKATA